MTTRRIAPALVALVALATAACLRGSDAKEPGDDVGAGERLRELPGYAAGHEPEPVFGGEVWVRRAGPRSGRTIVLVHGSGRDASRSFDPILASLARDNRVIALDLPGFGYSETGNRRYTPFRYAKVVRHVVRRHAGGPITLIGHSLGGNVALIYAALRPDEVERLVLLDVVGVMHREIYMRRTMPGGGLIARAMRYPGADQPRARHLVEDPELRARYLRGNPVAIAGLALMLGDVGPFLDRVRAPTLLLWGADDRIAHPRAARALRARIPGARLEVIEDAAHTPMRDRPDVVLERVSRWMRAPWTAPVPGPARPALEGVERVGRCEGEEGRRFEGAWARIELDRCGGVRIEDATVGRIIARDSVAFLQDARVTSDGVAIDATESVLRMTGGGVEGSTCIDSHGSELDVAGAVLRCGEAAVRSSSRSTLLFSVTRLERRADRQAARHLHERVSLAAGDSL